jgi:hypothetical protein
MRRRSTDRTAWTPNQIVAFNVARARLLRGWTQDEAAAELAPYLGQRLSSASFSALERSIDGGRIRQFSADDLLALARGFDLPIGWFLTPPSRMDDVDLATPDHPDGTDPAVLLDAVLGTSDTLASWREVLLVWPDMRHRVRVQRDGSVQRRGRKEPDVHDRLDELSSARAQIAARQEFGNIDAALDALRRLQSLLERVDDTATPASGPR